MKVLKTLGKVVLWTVVALLALVLALPLWIGPVVRGVANSTVPGVVGTEFHLGDFGLNPYTGCVRVGDMQLANPTNFSKENCVELGKVEVNLAMTSLGSKKIRIEEIDLDGLLVAATTGGGNFRQIAMNASGESEEAAGPEQSAESGKPGQGAPSAEGQAPAAEESASGGDEGGRVQIDKIRLRNIKIKIGMVTFPIPSMEIDGIGADKEEGATFADAWDAIVSAVLKTGGAVGELGKSAVDAGAKAAGAAVDAGAKAAGAAVDAVGGAAGATVDAVGNAAGAAADAVGNAAGAAADAVKGLFK